MEFDVAALKDSLFKRPRKLALGLSAAAIALFQLAPSANAGEFSRIYAFGDSLSDTGNAYAKTGVPSAPYFKGHFSNGPVWTEYLAEDLGIPETNLAYGGAVSGESSELQFGSAPAVTVPGVLSQTQSFIAASPDGIDQEALYVIWVGANDYLSGEQRDSSVPVINIRSAVSMLSQAGAQNFLLVNLPKLGELPLFDTPTTPPETISALNSLSAQHNAALAQTVADLSQSNTLNVSLLDVYSLYESVTADATLTEASEPSEVEAACILIPDCVSAPSTQNSYLFWDSIHPTTAAHRLIANRAMALIEARQSKG